LKVDETARVFRSASHEIIHSGVKAEVVEGLGKKTAMTWAVGPS
jgi:hypothetical protein